MRRKRIFQRPCFYRIIICQSWCQRGNFSLLLVATPLGTWFRSHGSHFELKGFPMWWKGLWFFLLGFDETPGLVMTVGMTLTRVGSGVRRNWGYVDLIVTFCAGDARYRVESMISFVRFHRFRVTELPFHYHSVHRIKGIQRKTIYFISSLTLQCVLCARVFSKSPSPDRGIQLLAYVFLFSVSYITDSRMRLDVVERGKPQNRALVFVLRQNGGHWGKKKQKKKK